MTGTAEGGAGLVGKLAVSGSVKVVDAEPTFPEPELVCAVDDELPV